jgi:hypothetical protein
MNGETSWFKDLRKGKAGEQRYKGWLQQHNYKFIDLSHNPTAQRADIDLKIKVGERWRFFEIRNNYRDDYRIIIEEWANLGTRKKGWWYTTKADFLVCCGRTTFVVLAVNNHTRRCFDWVRGEYPERFNEVSRNGTTWQSSFRCVPLEVFDGAYLIKKW